MQRALASVSYRERGNVKMSLSDINSFDDFNLLPLIKESIATQALPGLETLTPTPIQRLAIPAFLGQDDEPSQAGHRSRMTSEQFLMAAETGSGKTLAYLLPVLDAIKRAEAVDAEAEKRYRAEVTRREQQDPTFVEPPPLNDAPHATCGRPRAIILVPTSELVNQVSNLAKAFSHTIKFRPRGVHASLTPTVIRNRLFAPQGIDLVISTPSLLASITESDPNILARVTHMVIDEADSLMDQSFAPITTTLIAKAASSLRKLILCSATIPRSLDNYLRTQYPDMKRLVTPNLHAIPRRVQLGVVDVEKDPYRGSKLLACADTIWTIGKANAEHHAAEGDEAVEVDRNSTKRILVFVNEREKALEVAEYLTSKGINASALNRDTSEHRQSELLSIFTGTTVPGKSQSTPPARFSPLGSTSSPPRQNSDTTTSRRQLPGTQVLVTTDLGSRGIDTIAVRHVILYDVPHSTVDFIHRLGRTGRMGRRGRGIVLVGKGDRKDVVREVREGMFRGMALI